LQEGVPFSFGFLDEGNGKKGRGVPPLLTKPKGIFYRLPGKQGRLKKKGTYVPSSKTRTSSPNQKILYFI
jgi:hypothetical protein